uniref:Heterogeneous nuclear ribonucleoprotein U-like protein 1-like n=1 Tax=Saccoglossus kowalevskii TaxID=10224 RepID=A0ABM0MGB5_SACKO|nr:PREDICTED: heterogeneous nuclear ribonucleoprotein U-like protein 1-like [Saccoglossus kowalevskii]
MYQQPASQANRITLDDYNSDLHISIGPDGVTGWDMHDKGFEYLWAGVRASHGVARGKVCFECTVVENSPVDMPDTESAKHVCRVGWSVHSSNSQLGESNLSYGYGGTGKSSSNNKFLDYGQPYGVGDTITCYLDLEANPKAIFFAKNGQYLGVAFNLGPEINGKTLFPHINVKNTKFEVNFGDRSPRFPLTPGFQMIQWLPPHALLQATIPSTRKEDHEIIMMVGLPGAGKSTWAEEYARKHPEKNFYILGTNAIIDKMKVMGLKRQKNYHGRWDVLIKQATDCLNKIFKVAERRVRNYILDQTNVYFTARRRKMNNFKGYRRIAAVVVNTPEELKKRTEKREKDEGKFVPESAVKEMMANFSLPEVGESFDEVWFVEEEGPKAIQLVADFKKDGMLFKQAGQKRGIEDSSQPDSKRFASSQDGFSPRVGPRGPSPRGGPGGYAAGGPPPLSRGPPPFAARGPPPLVGDGPHRDYYPRGVTSDYRSPSGGDYGRGPPALRGQSPPRNTYQPSASQQLPYPSGDAGYSKQSDYSENPQSSYGQSYTGAGKTGSLGGYGSEASAGHSSYSQGYGDTYGSQQARMQLYGGGQSVSQPGYDAYSQPSPAYGGQGNYGSLGVGGMEGMGVGQGGGGVAGAAGGGGYLGMQGGAVDNFSGQGRGYMGNQGVGGMGSYRGGQSGGNLSSGYGNYQ